VQDRSILQLTMEADFVEGLPHIEGEVIHKGKRENWNIRVMFTLRQRGFWEMLYDKISLRVTSEERKWANDYVDRFEEQIHKLPSGSRTPTMLFWLYVLPLSIFVRDLLVTGNRNAYAMREPFLFYIYYGTIFISIVMVAIGVSLSLFRYNPQLLRFLFGPISNFAWGEGKVEYDAIEKFRQMALWIIGFVFLLVMFSAVKFVMG